MWTTEVNVITTAPPEAIWNRWMDLPTWSDWLKDFEWVRLDGDFTVGKWGTLKLRSGPTLIEKIAALRPWKWVLTEVEVNKGFSDRAPQFLGTMYFHHRLQRVEGGTKVTQRIEIGGPLGWLYARLVGKMFAERLPIAVKTLVSLVEQAQRGR